MSEVKGHRVQGLFGAKGAWVMTLLPDGMVLAPARGGGLEYEIDRDEIADIVTLKDPAIGGPCLIVKSEKRLGFRLGRRASAAYAEWRGPLEVGDLRRALKSAMVWAIPVGLIFMATSVPIPGDDPIPFDIFSLVMGIALAAIGVLSRVARTRWLFVVHGLWWVGLAAKTVAKVIGGDSPAWLALTVIALLYGFEQIQNFRRFPPDRELVGPSPQDAEETELL